MRGTFRRPGGVLTLVVAVAAFALAYSRSSAESPATGKGPFTLFEGHYLPEHSSAGRSAIFRIDAQTGATWMYVESASGDDGAVVMRWVRIRD